MNYPCSKAYEDAKNAISIHNKNFIDYIQRRYDAVKSEIRKAAKKYGDFFLYKEKDSIDPDVIELLLQDGYTVSKQYDSIPYLLIFRKKILVGYMIEWDHVI